MISSERRILLYFFFCFLIIKSSLLFLFFGLFLFICRSKSYSMRMNRRRRTLCTRLDPCSRGEITVDYRSTVTPSFPSEPPWLLFFHLLRSLSRIISISVSISTSPSRSLRSLRYGMRYRLLTKWGLDHAVKYVQRRDWVRTELA